MNRREMLRNMMFSSVAAGLAPLSYPMQALAASCPAPVPDMDRTLVNVMLDGGVDFRFVFMPVPGTLDPNHESILFYARKNLYAASLGSIDITYSELFDLEYDAVAGQDFGIHKSCGWLKNQFESGNVAIVANAYCSRNRRHDQSILNADAGEPDFNQLIQDRDGWGGRLMEQISPDANTVELGNLITVFNKGTTQGNRLAQVIHAQNMRDIALPDVISGGGYSRPDSLVRALKGYYQARGMEVLAEKPDDWPFHTFFDHEAALRAFGGEVSERLTDCGALPPSLLPASQGGDFNLVSNLFEQQCRNLYDVCLAPDLLGGRALSMNYRDWDTHGSQENRMTLYLGDILGNGGGLDRVSNEINALPSNAINQLTLYFASEFGRQLVANGDLGTDHGSGTYSVLMGANVTGGVYGTMFPVEESLENDGIVPLQTHGTDITGLTSTENVLAEVCEWMQPGSAAAVFPNLSSANVEAGVDLSGLMA